ncbi:hypothetical protein [Tropicibacter naphthalenivorans]|uniref:Uncharacterized protein n=1 Tax=Tropicibacter naphthalenivorans TaxID=441103 RepID=A0A0P1GFN7_9RHOB|nr:hypothetical protein [Tropicibacter naphthalenivorans]CUH80314.1 hypothetical protein TRN7648_02925 [Tropicibacter naphthalenivorans]SMC85806.1 hypothetical protein SAMN04488093_105194 [Tropicibacter naphthalenivorans]
MSAVWDFLLSPWGVAAYGMFWVAKLLAGAWVLRRAVSILPQAGQVWVNGKIGVMRGLMARLRPPAV